MRRIHVIDSHTGGEPTRTVISGGPDLGNCSVAARLGRFRALHDHWRSAIVNEPRGSDAVVGALLCEPIDPSCTAGVIFFNNVGYLGMCGHGSIGVAATLAYLGKISTGVHRLETPVGIVTMELHEDGQISIENVPSRRSARDVRVQVAGIGEIAGDVAWGGNWFFLTKTAIELQTSNLDSLTDFAWRVREALGREGITGDDGAPVDHIELFSAPENPVNHGRNFVLCPGKEYDRSPCGTGTSAKLACLFADGLLAEGEIWRQESIIGTVFEGSFQIRKGLLYPRIKGYAFISADSLLILEDEDPFRWGIRK